MKKNESVKNVMSSPVVTIHKGTKPSAVRDLFKTTGVHHLPVVDGKKLVGQISWLDMISLSFEAYGTDERNIAAILDDQFTVEKMMVPESSLTKALNTDTVRDVATKLSSGNFHSVPVVDADGNLQGIVTSTDMIKYLLSQY